MQKEINIPSLEKVAIKLFYPLQYKDYKPCVDRVLSQFTTFNVLESEKKIPLGTIHILRQQRGGWMGSEKW